MKHSAVVHCYKADCAPPPKTAMTKEPGRMPRLWLSSGPAVAQSQTGLTCWRHNTSNYLSRDHNLRWQSRSLLVLATLVYPLHMNT